MKAPAFQFYTGDWLKDPNLSMCSPSTRGVWMDLLCAMHELGRCGQVTGTVEQLCRLCRCTSAEMSAALTELESTKTAAVSERNGSVTVACRRMQREHKERTLTSARVRKYRGHDEETVSVTEVKRGSNSPPSSSSTTTKQKHSANAGADAPRPRAPDMVWGVGVQMLAATGMTEPNARSYLGNLSKKHGKEKLAQAIATTSAQNPVNPTEYLVKVLEGKHNAATNGNRKGPSLTDRAAEYADYYGSGEAQEDARSNHR